MSKRIVINPGDKFNRWTVIREADPANRNRRALCKCKCGTVSIVSLGSLRHGHSKSCGCSQVDKGRKISAGECFGNWSVIKELPKSGKYRSILCICSCGTQRGVAANSLFNGDSTSCGCRRTGYAGGMVDWAGTRLHKIYYSMIYRCYHAHSPAYESYGARGITICDEWMSSKEAFRVWAESSGYQENLFIDRKNNNSGYSPDNCRWVTRTENNRNTRRSKYWTVFGIEYDALIDAAEKNKVSRQSIKNWCDGAYLHSGAFSPPKPGCSSRLKYETT